jgi:hypothetical protein
LVRLQQIVVNINNQRNVVAMRFKVWFIDRMKITAKQIALAGGVTPSFGHMILNGTRKPSLKLALRIYDGTGFQCGPLAGITEENIAIARLMVPA